MGNGIRTALLVAVVGTMLPAAHVAPLPPAARRALAESQEARPFPTHAASGVVKSIDATTLVIARTGRHHRQIAFALDPDTHHDGPVKVGDTVQVRFRMEGGTRVATAIRVNPPAPPRRRITGSV